METAAITLRGDAQYVIVTMHDNFTGEDQTWVLPTLSAEQLGHKLLEFVSSKLTPAATRPI